MAKSTGTFEVEHTPPRLVAIKVKGDMEEEDINAIFDRIDALIAGQPYWLLKGDISEVGNVTQSARRAGARRIGQTPEYSLALYGGSLAQRALSTLFLKLSELFSGDKDIANKFCKDQESAHAWLLAEERRRRQNLD